MEQYLLFEIGKQMDNETLLTCLRVSKEWNSALKYHVDRLTAENSNHYNVIEANTKTRDISTMMCYMRKHWRSIHPRFKGRLKRYVVHRFTIWKPNENFYPVYAQKMVYNDVKYICGKEAADLLNV